jgi:hypothetical protein
MIRSDIARAKRAGLLVQNRKKTVCFTDPLTGECTTLGRGSSETWRNRRLFNSFVLRAERRLGLP